MEEIKEVNIRMSKSNNLLKKEKNQELFFKGYRPNFYFRTDDHIVEKPLSENILERVKEVINDNKLK